MIVDRDVYERLWVNRLSMCVFEIVVFVFSLSCRSCYCVSFTLNSWCVRTRAPVRPCVCVYCEWVCVYSTSSRLAFIRPIFRFPLEYSDNFIKDDGNNKNEKRNCYTYIIIQLTDCNAHMIIWTISFLCGTESQMDDSRYFFLSFNSYKQMA